MELEELEQRPILSVVTTMKMTPSRFAMFFRCRDMLGFLMVFR